MSHFATKPNVESIVWDPWYSYQFPTGEITYTYFPANYDAASDAGIINYELDPNTYFNFSAYHQSVMDGVFAAFEAVADVTFTEIAYNDALPYQADIRIGGVDLEGNVLGQAQGYVSGGAGGRFTTSLFLDDRYTNGESGQLLH